MTIICVVWILLCVGKPAFSGVEDPDYLFSNRGNLIDSKACPKCYLQGADLRGVDLVGANLKGANLKGANLTGVDLQGANLRGTDLRRANLTGADLQEADLWEANLQGAHLHRAYLRRAKINSAGFAIAKAGGAIGLDKVEVAEAAPSGSKPTTSTIIANAGDGNAAQKFIKCKTVDGVVEVHSINVCTGWALGTPLPESYGEFDGV